MAKMNTRKIFVIGLDSATFDLADIGLGGQIKLQLKRIAATGGTEFGDDVFLTQTAAHIYTDQDGSRTVSSK